MKESIMSNQFMKSGNVFRVRSKADVTTYDDLPKGTYTVKYDKQNDEFYLNGIDDFTLPAKIYGSNTNHAERIINTFMTRSNTTGVLLSGVKGSGKTLLAKQTAVLAATYDIPTIVINHPWFGEEFNTFIQGIHTPCIILFDEFEKVYGWSEQQKILTLLDGVYPTKKLYMLTTNDNSNVSSFLRNRPGRIYYNFEYGTLEQDFIEEYCNDNLNNKSLVKDILAYTQVFSFFNFDMLSAAVEEMNRYNETLPEVLEVLNIIPESSEDETHAIKLRMNGEEISIDPNYRGFSPNTFNHTVWLDEDRPSGINDDIIKELMPVSNADKSLKFTPRNIVSFDQVNNVFVYELNSGHTTVQLVVTRNPKVAEWKYSHVL